MSCKTLRVVHLKVSVILALPSLHPFTCFYYLFDGFLVYSSTLIQDVALLSLLEGDFFEIVFPTLAKKSATCNQTKLVYTLIAGHAHALT